MCELSDPTGLDSEADLRTLKNQSVGFLDGQAIQDHFLSQDGFDGKDVSVEYFIIRRSRDSLEDVDIDEIDNREAVFAGHTSFPGGVHSFGETSLDSVVRNTYQQTGIDLTDRERYCLIGQHSKNFIMRYLPNSRVIVAKPFVFCQLVPGKLPIPTEIPMPDTMSMYMWSHVEFLYRANLSKALEYREVTTEILKRRLKHVKIAHLKIGNAENYTLNEVIKNDKKCDPIFSLCGGKLV